MFICLLSYYLSKDFKANVSITDITIMRKLPKLKLVKFTWRILHVYLILQTSVYKLKKVFTDVWIEKRTANIVRQNSIGMLHYII